MELVQHSGHYLAQLREIYNILDANTGNNRVSIQAGKVSIQWRVRHDIAQGPLDSALNMVGIKHLQGAVTLSNARHRLYPVK